MSPAGLVKLILFALFLLLYAYPNYQTYKIMKRKGRGWVWWQTLGYLNILLAWIIYGCATSAKTRDELKKEEGK
jgi:hypothetical protein